MGATLPCVDVVNQVVVMSAYSLVLKVNKAYVPVHILTCPPEHGDGMIKYLRYHKCKFRRVMERRCWDRYHVIDRDVFYIETAPDTVINSLVKSTEGKGGKVDISSLATNQPQIDVDTMICPLTQDQLLTIRVNGEEIPATGDDSDDYEWWSSVPNIDIALTQFIEMAIDGIEADIRFYYDTRINLNLRELLESHGFMWLPDEECMMMANT